MSKNNGTNIATLESPGISPTCPPMRAAILLVKIRIVKLKDRNKVNQMRGVDSPETTKYFQ